MNINCLLDRVHSKTYNCADFASEAYRHLTGVDLPYMRLRGGQAMRGSLRLLEAPGPAPCIAIFSGRLDPHCGVWYRGKILHLPAGGMPIWQSLSEAAIGFKKVKFYQPGHER